MDVVVGDRREKDMKPVREKLMSWKMRIIPVTVIIIIIMLSLTAGQVVCYAENWVPAINSSYGIGYIDVDSIILVKDKKTIKFWNKTIFTDEGRRLYGEEGLTWANKVYEEKSLFLVNYGEKTYRTLSKVAYDSSGKTLDSLGENFKVKDIVHGSTVDCLMLKALELSGQDNQDR